MDKMTFVIDIDGTLIRSVKEGDEYKVIYIDTEEINAVNRLYAQGHEIILWTGRRWELHALTVKQMKNYGVKYHALVMGKPIGVYIDKDAHTTAMDFV